jgi:KH domain
MRDGDGLTRPALDDDGSAALGGRTHREVVETPKITRIFATVYVERPGQKAIIIGAGGSILKKIGSAARVEAEELLGRKIYLELFIEVKENWRQYSLEPLHPEYPQLFELWAPKAGVPPYIGLSGKKSESIVGRHQKPVAHLGAGHCSVVVGLVVEIPVRSGVDNVAGFAHRAPVFFRRSSRRRCFSSQ